MNDTTSNPYSTDATALLREAEQAYGPEHADAFTKAAAVKATLALAYEQRTANLIALEALLQASGADIEVDAIQARLGLA